MIRLKNEILLSITLAIDKVDEPNTNIRHLALAHCGFSGFVRNALVRNAIVPRYGASAYVALLQKHPEWATKIHQLELREFGHWPKDTKEAVWDCTSVVSKIFAPGDIEETGKLTRA
ncbi:uncharacterized protein M421DRAFT_397687 [Didymella exigua CBS 183.55]|uniref:Uncharacterized protein n=1 Tax=Didymella exigua CBS 183.55 TaxID=1150837 RepID=A0A6A5RFR8_9PLEO|nr:uncharacterized protein M421DRAFT_397687 [Didymella exigua CBS 183.55]KAF1925944.1 hypothetical protein M421DRAFT_397687 [Didymella exigua CBS 183.55]